MQVLSGKDSLPGEGEGGTKIKDEKHACMNGERPTPKIQKQPIYNTGTREGVLPVLHGACKAPEIPFHRAPDTTGHNHGLS